MKPPDANWVSLDGRTRKELADEHARMLKKLDEAHAGVRRIRMGKERRNRPKPRR